MNIYGHFKTITKHRHMVIYHCFKSGILWQGLRHDLSKYSPTEFIEGIKYYQGSRSPNEKARELTGCSLAWMHHKGRNKHHFEYWRDINLKTGKYEPVKMPVKYVIEMFCDRVAASKIYGGSKYNDGSPLSYFLNKKGEREIHPETSRLLESLLRMLAEKGEAETFKYIKRLRREMK